MKKEIFCRVWTKKGCQDLTVYKWFNFNRVRLHRLDGPAFEGTDGTKARYVNGKLHCLDGPAIEYSDGSKHWYMDGKYLPTDEIESWLKENKINLKTNEGQIAFKLRWM